MTVFAYWHLDTMVRPYIQGKLCPLFASVLDIRTRSFIILINMLLDVAARGSCGVALGLCVDSGVFLALCHLREENGQRVFWFNRLRAIVGL